MVTQIIDDLQDYGVAKETLAMDVWDPGLIEGFQSKGIKEVPATELMFEARKIKNQDEVECLRIAAAIGDLQMQTLKDMFKPGVKENEIMGSMHNECPSFILCLNKGLPLPLWGLKFFQNSDILN